MIIVPAFKELKVFLEKYCPYIISYYRTESD